METAKKIKWRWDWGVYVPFCPKCDEPVYTDEETTVRCHYCGQLLKWVEPKYKPTIVQVGEYTVSQATNNHIMITKYGQMLFHASCTKKKTEEELRGMVELYENLAKGKYDKGAENEKETD